MTSSIPMYQAGYDFWLEREGIPVVEGYGVEDIAEVERAVWPRMGGKGAYIKLAGMEGVTGMYVAEIPPGGALNPEKHLYEEVIYILRGQGATEVWLDGAEKTKRIFEWGAGSLFAPPLNTWHRLINGSREPVIFMAGTNAPLVMDIFYNPDFVFNCSNNFPERYDGQRDYFTQENSRIPRKDKRTLWATNFISDVRSAAVDESGVKLSGEKHTNLEIAGNTLIGHISDWPTGMYHKAHYHGGGAVITILRGKGYVLMWPKEAGIHPYRTGHEDQVKKIDWKAGGIYSPPSGWFHHHFSIGHDSVRQLAMRLGGRMHPIGFHSATSRQPSLKDPQLHGSVISIRDGGTLVDYEDEDPEIRKRFEATLKIEGVQSRMEPVVYRNQESLILGSSYAV